MWNFIEASFASSRLWFDGPLEVPMLGEQVVMRVSHANRLMKPRAVSATSRHPSSSCSCLVTVVIASPSTLQARSTQLANPRMHFQLPTAQLRVALAPRRGARRSSRPGTPRDCCHHQLSSDVNAP